MLNLININENNVAYVETGCGKVFGIVDAFHVTDEDGLKLEGKSVIDVLDDYTFIDHDYETEENIISFTEENGESSKLHINSTGLRLVDDNE